jgi:hypothetical protein
MGFFSYGNSVLSLRFPKLIVHALGHKSEMTRLTAYDIRVTSGNVEFEPMGIVTRTVMERHFMNVKVKKVKLSLCLTKHHTMET